MVVDARADELHVVAQCGRRERREEENDEEAAHRLPLYHEPLKAGLRFAMKAAMPSRASCVRAWSAMPCASSSICVSSDSAKLWCSRRFAAPRAGVAPAASWLATAWASACSSASGTTLVA